MGKKLRAIIGHKDEKNSEDLDWTAEDCDAVLMIALTRARGGSYGVITTCADPEGHAMHLDEKTQCLYLLAQMIREQADADEIEEEHLGYVRGLCNDVCEAIRKLLYGPQPRDDERVHSLEIN